MKRTYQPSKLVRARRHGFRTRMATQGGRKVLAGPQSQRTRQAFCLNQGSGQMPVFFKLKKRKDFVRAAKSGISIPTRSIVIQAVLRPEETAQGARIGYTTTKKNRQSRLSETAAAAPARRGRRCVSANWPCPTPTMC